MGDLNATFDGKLDRTNRTKGKEAGNLPRSLLRLAEEFMLVDSWRLQNIQKRQYTYYSTRHRVWSRIDMFWISASGSGDFTKYLC